MPSLVAQIQDYVSGQAHDPFFDVVAKPASDLTAAERRFALQYLFQANPVNMIGRYPRYRELWERYRTTQRAAGGRRNRISSRAITRTCKCCRSWRGLTSSSWLNLTSPLWCRRAKTSRATISSWLSPKQREILAKVLPAYADAAQRGSIELSATPYYHPILPLLCDTNAGAESSPGLTAADAALSPSR